ncbi:MAG: VWA domain-containing protein [Ignavibacteria bacterium]|nr:VWA domain-containing protein [Ignavibacteria bacterium]
MDEDFLYYALLLVYSSVLVFLFVKYYFWKIRLTKDISPQKSITITKTLLIVKFSLFFAMGIFFLKLFFDKSSISEKKEKETVITMDVSGSMLANFQDIERLQVAKDIAEEIVYTFDANFSIVAFAGNAYVMYPLSQDKSQVIETIRNLSPNNFSFQGSNLEKAIEKSLLSFSNANTDKIIIILSDGEIFDGNSEKYADECRDKNIKSFFVSLGDNNRQKVKPEKYRFTDKAFTTKSNHTQFKEFASLYKGFHFKVDELIKTNDLINYLKAKIQNQKNLLHSYEKAILLFLLVLLIFVVRL